MPALDVHPALRVRQRPGPVVTDAPVERERSAPLIGCGSGRTFARIERLEDLAFGVARRVVEHCRQSPVGCQVLVAVNEEAAALITGTQSASTLLHAGTFRTFTGEKRIVAAEDEVKRGGCKGP